MSKMHVSGLLLWAVILCSAVWCPARARGQANDNIINLQNHNVIPNPSFEKGDKEPSDWSTKRREGGKTAQFEWAKEKAHTGRRSVMVYSQPLDAQCWGAWTTTVPVRGGIKWYFSGWAKAESVDRGGLSLWVWLGNRPKGFGDAEGIEGWHQDSNVIMIPPGFKSVPVGIEFRRAVGRAWADDLLAVPYFLKVTADLQREAEALGSGPAVPAAFANDLRHWISDVQRLAKRVVHWRRQSDKALKKNEVDAEALQLRLGKMKDGIALAKLRRPVAVQAFRSLTPIYQAPRDLPDSPYGEGIEVSAARGETEPFQVAVIAPEESISGLRFECTSLAGPNGASLPERQPFGPSACITKPPRTHTATCGRMC